MLDLQCKWVFFWGWIFTLWRQKWNPLWIVERGFLGGKKKHKSGQILREKKKVRNSLFFLFFGTMSSCRSPELGRISKKFQPSCLASTAKFGSFLLWMITTSPPTWENCLKKKKISMGTIWHFNVKYLNFSH
jgi:hypothetical protein